MMVLDKVNGQLNGRVDRMGEEFNRAVTECERGLRERLEGNNREVRGFVEGVVEEGSERIRQEQKREGAVMLEGKC